MRVEESEAVFWEMQHRMECLIGMFDVDFIFIPRNIVLCNSKSSTNFKSDGYMGLLNGSSMLKMWFSSCEFMFYGFI